MEQKLEEKEEDNKEEETHVESPLEESRRLVAEMKQQNSLLQQNITQLSELKAHDMLSGSASAGQPSNKPKEESDKEYTERIMRGDLNEQKGEGTGSGN